MATYSFKLQYPALDTFHELDLATQNAVSAIDALLPQTQCRQCGTDGCLAYARAMVEEGAPHNRCAPGGEQGVVALGKALHRAPLTLDPDYGQEVPFARATIDPHACIGCAWCVSACPTGAIHGSPKHLHQVDREHCTGCGLCLPVCPMDCIHWVEDIDHPWTHEKALEAKTWFSQTLARRRAEELQENERLNALRAPRAVEGEPPSTNDAEAQKKKAFMAAILKKARSS